MKLKNAMIRWRQSGDISAFVDIDTYSAEYFWTRKDFETLLLEPNINCFVVSRIGKPVGFLIYEKGKKRYYILNLSVHPDFRYFGIGSMLLDKLKSKGREIRCDVRESNLGAHLFLQKNGFKAKKILRDCFIDNLTKEAAYSFYF